MSSHRCPTAGTHLERYARVFHCAEINSSFYRPHAPATYAKWGASTPEGFSFALKVPRLITHELGLRRSRAPVEQFVAETASLGGHRGPLLVQLPPSLVFESRPVMKFFDIVRSCYDGPVVCEPRHPTWFSAGAEAVLKRFAVARVAADPLVVEESRTPGGWDGIAYFRLHGSPRMYWSRYDASYLSQLATMVGQIAQSADVWCVFDNTASGSAFDNAWEFQTLIKRSTAIPEPAVEGGRRYTGT